VLAVFTRLGLTSFGGPIAHIGYFRHELVARRGWLSEDHFADLIALCQFLPGPASSQLGFAIGLERAGFSGGIAAFAGFTTPSALLMFAAAAGWFLMPGQVGASIVHGLLLVSVSVVASAVYGMGLSHCRDRFTAGLAIAALVALLVVPLTWLPPVVIACGAAAGVIATKADAPTRERTPATGGGRIGAMLFAAFIGLLIGLPLLASIFSSPALSVADAFYRSGALVFGGGHVVLPLLEAETVGRHWLPQSTFLAGYGAAQALPGPLFTFAAFLGAASDTGLPAAAGAAIALVAIFLPGLLLVSAALPFWGGIKQRPWAVGLVRGANAAVVGVLAAALYNPVCIAAIQSPLDIVIAASGFIALQVFRAPAWLVVVLVAGGGAAAFLLG
jgi:chromate transporter